MRTFHKEDNGLYSAGEANICLTCEKQRCSGNCARLQEEKRRLQAEQKAQKKPKPREEFIIPDKAPWTKRKKHKSKEE